MLQTSFPKLEKHPPTRLYMLYPMVQSVARFRVEIDKQMTLQRLCSPLSSLKKNSFSLAQLFKF
jgi:hypothetical protein